MVYVVSYCRAKGQWRIRLFGPAHQTLACCLCLAHRRRSTTALTKRRPQSDSELEEESPRRARDKNVRLCERPPAAWATPMAPAGVSGLWPMPAAALHVSGAGAQPFPTASDKACVAGAWVWCAAPPGAPWGHRLRAARRACAWPRYRPRCSVASWRGWYGPPAPARPGDSPRPATRGAPHA